jgi:hypothetical protein
MIYSHPIASDLPRGSKTASDQAKRLCAPPCHTTGHVVHVVQVASDLAGDVRAISDPYPGSWHDVHAYAETGWAEHVGDDGGIGDLQNNPRSLLLQHHFLISLTARLVHLPVHASWLDQSRSTSPSSSARCSHSQRLDRSIVMPSPSGYWPSRLRPPEVEQRQVADQLHRTSGALQKSFKLGQLSTHRSVQHVGPSSRLHTTYRVYHRAPTLTIMDCFDSTARHISGGLRPATTSPQSRSTGDLPAPTSTGYSTASPPTRPRTPTRARSWRLERHQHVLPASTT